jgi:hypothetical protein
MHKHHFLTLINPYGTVYNPVSIAHLVHLSFSKKWINDVYYDEVSRQYFHYDFHSSFNNSNKEEFLSDINKSIINTNNFLNEIDVVFITFGTSWVYRHMVLNSIVANCHKQAQSTFEKELLSSDQIDIAINDIITTFQNQNSSVQIIFTLSPVRHIKDGIIENSLSKARLLDAMHRSIAKNNNCFYFPSYEIMMDDLRDYRFYKKDLIHPNEMAIEYIWNYLKINCMCEETHIKLDKIAKINTFFEHRPFNNEDINYLQKKQALEIELKQLLND